VESLHGLTSHELLNTTLKKCIQLLLEKTLTHWLIQPNRMQLFQTQENLPLAKGLGRQQLSWPEGTQPLRQLGRLE
jgi:hypothetical protein